MSEQDVNELMSKIAPLRGEQNKIFLTKQFLKELSDIEFSILWHLPNLTIIITPAAKDFIEIRREKLGLKFSSHASIS